MLWPIYQCFFFCFVFFVNFFFFNATWLCVLWLPFVTSVVFLHSKGMTELQQEIVPMLIWSLNAEKFNNALLVSSIARSVWFKMHKIFCRFEKKLILTIAALIFLILTLVSPLIDQGIGPYLPRTSKATWQVFHAASSNMNYLYVADIKVLVCILKVKDFASCTQTSLR